MNKDFKNHEQNELTDRIIKIFYKVYDKLGYGFLEKVYQNAMMIEFKRAGINATAQSPIRVLYDKEIVGEYFADILVDEKVIVEKKASRSLTQDNEAQLLNYLKATDVEVGLLLNFGPKAELKRKLFDNFRKK
jgi:GxxExxY protein